MPSMKNSKTWDKRVFLFLQLSEDLFHCRTLVEEHNKLQKHFAAKLKGWQLGKLLIRCSNESRRHRQQSHRSKRFTQHKIIVNTLCEPQSLNYSECLLPVDRCNRGPTVLGTIKFLIEVNCF